MVRAIVVILNQERESWLLEKGFATSEQAAVQPIEVDTITSRRERPIRG